jgi:ribosome biogenesis GTPase
MAGRKLSHNQARRVSHMQRQRVDRALAAESDEQPTGEERRGRVISRFGKQADVEDLQDPAAIMRCHIRATVESVVAGDVVVWQPDGDTGVVTARLERASELCRPDAQGRLRAVAANLDRLVVVLAVEPEPFPNLLDRYLVAAEDAGIEALVLLNKSDLAAGAARIHALLEPYAAIGYRVLGASAAQAQGLEALRDALAGHTAAFVGQSGVGKSSLISALLPLEEIRIGDLSAAELKGRHTTTTARLYHLPGGGALIDSPGIRDFSLAFMDPARTAAGFREFHPFLGQCRFRDCAHRHEPGCALRAAVADGAISEARYAGYLHIIGDHT